MTLASLSFRRGAALLAVAVSLVALGVAFAAQHLGGLAPCVLCLYQRWPYAAAILLGLLAALLAEQPAAWRTLLSLAGLAFLASAGIAAFHVGVEQHWWAGTAECTGAIPAGLSIDQLKQELLNAPVVRCDEVRWSLFGLSMAGYNFLYAGACGLLALWAALRPRPKARSYAR